MKKLATSWKIMIGFLFCLHVLTFPMLDYQNDTLAAIIIIPLLPLLGIGAILIWGPSKP